MLSTTRKPWTSPDTEWRCYRKNLEKSLFLLRWNQNQALSQRMPRVSKTEGSPIKVILTRRGPRAWRTADQTSRNRETKISSDGRPQTISYRLPKLPENVLAGSTPSHPYVYKETFNESHFLLRKDDPPRTAIPLTSVSSYNKLVSDASRKQLKTSPQKSGDFDIVQPSALKLDTLFPGWKAQNTVFPNLENLTGKVGEPGTPPQSEIDINMMLSVHQAEKQEGQDIAAPKDHQGTATHFPAVFADKSETERKLTWQLSPYDNKNFDKQGLGPNQGPFSRELPKKCMPPTNWLRMKLRHRLHFTKANHPPIQIR